MFSAAFNSKSNKLLNNKICSKAPKTRHYRSSESNDFRVAAAVCQRNYGTAYLKKVHADFDLTPGKVTREYSLRVDKETAYQVLHKSSREVMLRRVELRKENLREGASYRLGKGRRHRPRKYPYSQSQTRLAIT